MTVTVRLTHFGRDALEDYARGHGGSLAGALDVAVRYYLADSQRGRVVWAAPGNSGLAETSEAIELELEDGLHGELRSESRRQQVTPEQLAVHALMYYLADLDSGRAAANVLGDRQ